MTQTHDAIIVRACGWSDGGAEFAFLDGTVMVAHEEMCSFALYPPSPPEVALTSLHRSTHRAKLRAALSVYNALSHRPRLIDGLIDGDETVEGTPEATRRVSGNNATHSPIPQTTAHATTSPLAPMSKHAPMDSVVLSADPSLFSIDADGSVTVDDAHRRARATIPRGRRCVRLRWTTAVDGGGRRRARAVEVVQMFPIDACPPPWDEMVRLALAFHAGGADAVVQATDGGKCRALPTPPTLGNERGRLVVPPLAGEDAAALAAAEAMEGTWAAKQLHPLPAMPLWRVELSGRHTITWCHGSPRRPRLTQWIREDGSVMELNVETPERLVVVHSRGDDASREYCLSLQSKVSFPARALWENAAGGVGGVDLPLPWDERGLREPRGRYVPSAGAALVALAGEILRRRTPPDGFADPSIEKKTAAESIVVMESTVRGVGTFKALRSGVVRGLFEDRTIVSIWPDEERSVGGSVATMVARDGSTRHVHIHDIPLAHDVAPYIHAMLQFRAFAALSPEQRVAMRDGPERDASDGDEVAENAELLRRTRELLSRVEETAELRRHLLHLRS